MLIQESFKTALISLSANKTRTFLTLLGVVIGVFAVVSLVAIGKGAQNYITKEFDALGSNLLFVSPGSGDFAGDPALQLTKNPLEEKHIKLIQNYANEHIVAISPYYVIGETAEYKTKNFFAEITGVNVESIKMFNYNVTQGREFTTVEEKNSSKVAIVGPQIQKELFENVNPLDKLIKIGGDSYKVIGVFEEKGDNYDDQIIVPYTSAENTFKLENYSSIIAKVDSTENVKISMKQVELALLRDLDEESFAVLSQEDILNTIQETLGIVTLGISLIAGISLLVGGIGIMNIMLVSVTERIKEIGLRKALGATPVQIGVQFVIEAIILSVVGGLLGLTIGALLIFGASQFYDVIEMPISAAVLAVVFSIAVGLIFGTYPAVKASKKDPVEALTFE
ncbi:MAG: ABC transporter permease [Patescibacteria group bacterium]